MTSKGLSNSTLSLRFMQNAQRAKQLKEVELDRAEIEDDGKWEVSQAIRDSWGISRVTQAESSDIHEASYLPFIFSAGDGDVSEVDSAHIKHRKASGRRLFNKHGQEVTMEMNASGTSASPVVTVPSQESKGRKVHPRPVSISASGPSGQLRDFEKLDKPKRRDSTKTARQTIFENSGVGTDLRTQARTGADPSKPTTFLKPAGIDVPKGIQTTQAALASNSDNNINGALSEKKKREREHDVTAVEPGDVSMKPKKRKKKKDSE